MLSKMKQLFDQKNKDLRKKILFTFVLLFIFKLGTTIIVPGLGALNYEFSRLGFLELVNVMGGGAMEQFSIFALGVMPYITASIIVQLGQMDIIPYLADLAKEGHTGRVKLNRISRILGIIMAFINGYMMSFMFIENGTAFEYVQFATILTAGTSLLLWMGDQITAKGIGNGISLLIMAGIIASMPSMFMTAYESLTASASFGTILFMIFILIYFLIIVGVIFVETAERRIPIQYSNKSTPMGGNQNYIPFKLNSAGVIPVIFGSSFLIIPTFIAGMIKNEGLQNAVEKYLSMQSPTGFVLYIILIIGFSFFYTQLQMKPKDIAENLNKNGGYIPGIRPGTETQKYISAVLNRLTSVGSLFLAFIAGLPILFSIVSDLPQTVSIGGTGLLIVVGVALETYKKIESEISSKNITSRKKGRRK